MKGATLGDAEPAGDEDTLKWIKKSKKREKMLAKKRMEELENMDKVFQGDDYTESTSTPNRVSTSSTQQFFLPPEDLVGLKVSHDFEEMDEGDARILTLKDSRILDNEGTSLPPITLSCLRADLSLPEDELHNVEMAEDERTKKNNDLKIKKRDYTGYDDDEFAPGVAGVKRSVLSKYDEDIDGIQETVSPVSLLLWRFKLKSPQGFRLGSSSAPSASAQRKKQEESAASVNKSLLSIDYDSE